MTVSPAALWNPTQLGTSPAALYTAPGGVKAVVKRAVFTNTDAAARTLTVYKVPAAGAAGVTNAVISAMSLSPGQAYVAQELANLVLAPGEAVYALADVAAKVNAVGSGFTA